MIDFLEIRKKTENMNLLYVEDDNITRMSSLSLYEQIFSDVFIATNGQEGLELFLENKDSIDIIITDENMPELKGIEMIKEIRKVNKEVLIYLFSGYSTKELSSQIEDLSISANFTKPVDYTDFLNSLNTKL